MQSTSMAGVPMNCINWLALGAVVYDAMDKRNALKVLGLKEQIDADVLQQKQKEEIHLHLVVMQKH